MIKHQLVMSLDAGRLALDSSDMAVETEIHVSKNDRRKDRKHTTSDAALEHEPALVG